MKTYAVYVSLNVRVKNNHRDKPRSFVRDKILSLISKEQRKVL